MLLSRLASIGTSPAIQAWHALALQPSPLTTQRAHRETASLAVGQAPLLPAQLLEIPLALPLGNFSQQHGTQQRAPKHRPVFVVTTLHV